MEKGLLVGRDDVSDCIEGHALSRYSMSVVAISIGNELGVRRTGALSRVAAKHLTGGTGRNVGVIGTGQQVWALGGFTTPTRVRTYPRNPSARKDFAAQVNDELQLDADPATDRRTAVTDADLVILAANSPVPALDSGWFEDNVAVITLGPKQVGRADFPADLVTAPDFVVTDSSSQLAS